MTSVLVKNTSPLEYERVGSRGFQDANGIKHPANVVDLWSVDELAAIGVFDWQETVIPDDEQSTGYEDTFSGTTVTRTHATEPIPEPEEEPEPEPEPVAELSFNDLRINGYIEAGADFTALLVAMWEHVIEGRPEAAAALEVKRQSVKAQYPKA
jgi:hypothetical protein